MKKIKAFEKKALSWNDVDGAEELKKAFEKFNKCYKILIESKYIIEYEYFIFCNDLLRHHYNKPFCCNGWKKLPEELVEYAERVRLQMEEFLLNGKALSINEVNLPRWNKDFTDEQNNIMLECSGIASYEKSFRKKFKFQDDEGKNACIEVTYGDLKANQLPYFSTSGSSADCCGQCQNKILPKDSILRDFWEKWDYYHCQTLTIEEYKELIKDIEILEEEYGK